MSRPWALQGVMAGLGQCHSEKWAIQPTCSSLRGAGPWEGRCLGRVPGLEVGSAPQREKPALQGCFLQLSFGSGWGSLL